MKLLKLLETKASDEAKKQGLDYYGFGRYGKDNTVTHKATPSGLEKVEPHAVDSKDKSNKSSTEKQPSSRQPSNRGPVEPIIQKVMPKSDIPSSDAIDNIDNSARTEVSTVIDKLNDLTKDAISKGEKAPNYDLCQVSIPGTNLFCGDNKGVPRKQMPQFKGVPEPGSPADKLPKDDKGEVDTEKVFSNLLKDNGVKTMTTSLRPDQLKATQNQLVGAKVAGMASALEKNPNHPGITAPIYVSRDGYVLDGHHRWAAMLSYAIKHSSPLKTRVKIVDMDIKDLLPLANKYAEDIGIAPKAAKNEGCVGCKKKRKESYTLKEFFGIK